jgi:hypothetical protein
MIKRLSAVVFGLVIAGGLGLAMAPSAQASAEATAPVRCIGNWVNAPCIGPEAKAPTMASRVVTPVAQPRVAQPRVTERAPRRVLHRSKPAAQRKLIRMAARTAARECTGNWVNAACASP